MPVPVQLQLFDAFLGTQEGIHSIILPDIFSSGGSKNVYIDKFGRVSQMLGYTRQNSSAFVTNGSSSTTHVAGLMPYRATGGGTTTRKLLLALDDGVDEWEIWVSTDNGATATFLYDAGSGSVGQSPDAAQYGDKIYVTNGKVVPRVYDGTTISAAGLTQSPTITATETSTTGNLLGNYTYKLVSTIGGARQNGSDASTSVLVSNKRIDLSWTADADTNVDGYEIYRTSGVGTTYYYLTSIDGRTTVSYTDNIADEILLESRILEEHGDPPPTCYFVEPHKGRLWWLRTDTFPTRGYWSDAGLPESVYTENFLDFSDSETVGDVITGALGNFEGLLVVFSEKALWTVSGTGAVIGDIVDWTKTKTNAQTGSVSHKTAVRVPAGSKYSDQTGQIQSTSTAAIAYFTPLGDIRLFDGDNDLIISHPVRDTVKEFTYEHRKKAHALHDSENEQIIWFFPHGGTGTCNKAVVWNYRFGVWYVWDPMPFASSAATDSTTEGAVMLVGQALSATGGFVYRMFSGSSFDGTGITAVWMTKTLYGTNEQGLPALSNRKRWRWADLLFKVAADVDITVEWLNGIAPDTAASLASTTISPENAFLVSADGSFIVSADGSFLVTSHASVQEKVLLKVGADYLHDEGIRLKVSTTSAEGQTGNWSLEAMELAYQILPGLKRRDQ